VLFSLQSGFTSNLSFLADLAARMHALRGTDAPEPDLKEVARLVEDEVFVRNRRRLLPSGFTGGPKVYIADLHVERRCLWKGQLTGGVLYCLVEPGDEGRIELIPWQVVADEG
jgi:hypothetical protein